MFARKSAAWLSLPRFASSSCLICPSLLIAVHSTSWHNRTCVFLLPSQGSHLPCEFQLDCESGQTQLDEFVVLFAAAGRLWKLVVSLQGTWRWAIWGVKQLVRLRRMANREPITSCKGPIFVGGKVIFFYSGRPDSFSRTSGIGQCYEDQTARVGNIPKILIFRLRYRLTKRGPKKRSSLRKSAQMANTTPHNQKRLAHWVAEAHGLMLLLWWPEERRLLSVKMLGEKHKT